MSNVKLVDDLWASEGLYDTAQNKSQSVLNPKLIYRSHSDGSAVTSLVGDLVAYLARSTNTVGFYVFTGSWTQHSYGYTAFCSKQDYDINMYSYSGLIIAYDGNVWTFTSRTGASNVVRKVTVTTV